MENFPSAALRAHVGAVVVDGGCAQISAFTTAAPPSAFTMPLIVEWPLSWTTLVESASTTSAHVLPTASRVGARGVDHRVRTGTEGEPRGTRRARFAAAHLRAGHSESADIGADDCGASGRGHHHGERAIRVSRS